MKTGRADLAILGGRPAFASPLHVGAPNQGDRALLHSLIDECLDRNWLTNDGPLLQKFEREIAERCGVSHCVAMTNGTTALEAAITACDLTGEVIVPSFTFVATVHAVRWQHLTPVFCDIDPQSHTLDVNAVRSLVTPRTSGIIGVHLWGEPCDVAGLEQVATEHNLALLFDAAHAFGCSLGDRRIGSFGRCEVLSFHATKFVQSGEGGAVVTSDGKLADRLRLLRNFGFRGTDDVGMVGTNGKMSELCAAMGLTSLASMDHFLNVNRTNYEIWADELQSVPGLNLFRFGESGQRNFQYVVVVVDPDVSPLTRDEIICALNAENVMARRYFYPGIHRLPVYSSETVPVLPVTERIADRVMALPTGTRVGEESIRRIGQLLRTITDAASEVRSVVTEQQRSPADIRLVHDFPGHRGGSGE